MSESQDSITTQRKEDFMKHVTIDRRGKVAVLHLDNGDTNPISPKLVDDLLEAQTIIRKDFGGMVLTGSSKFFCIGFDLPSLVHFDRTQMSDFLRKFNGLVLNLYTLPVPTCCAVAGHAIAGGNILMLASDFRLAASGKKLIGLNEIKLGVPVPYLADLILRQLIGDRAATGMLYSGEFITTSDAKKTGLVDDVVSPEDVEAMAIEKVMKIADLPQAAFSEIKANRTEAIRSLYEQNCRRKDEYFLDCWFSDPVQALMKEAAKKF
jgi:enoyl-CoA hydratase/carnithine racemase